MEHVKGAGIFPDLFGKDADLHPDLLRLADPRQLATIFMPDKNLKNVGVEQVGTWAVEPC